MEDQKISREEHNSKEEKSGTYPDPSNKRLYKSPTNFVLFGICGGIGKYLNISPVLFRIIFAVTAVLGGWGIVAYAVCYVFIPEHPEVKEEKLSRKIFSQRVIGFILIGLGIYFWIPHFGIFKFINSIEISDSFFLSGLIIILGFVIITRGSLSTTPKKSKPKKLYRSLSNRRLMGVCAGFAEYLQTDVNLLRILFILISFITLGLAFLFYLVISFFVPSEKAVEVMHG